MHTEIWYFLACALDTIPFIYFLYQPLKPHLRFSFRMTVAINYTIMLLASFGFVLLHRSNLYSLGTMLGYRLLSLLVLFLLVLLLVRSLHTKALFVFSLVIPFIGGILMLAGYIAQFIKGDTPTYMVSSLIRLGITVLLYPLCLWLWREIGRRADKFTDPKVWQYLWVMPTSVALSEMLLIENTYESHGVHFTDLLGRVALWIGSVATCWLLFYLADKFEQRIHLQDAKERNDLLLTLQAEQYQKLAESIEEARATRHDMRHHLNAMIAMSNNQEYARLNDYLVNLLERIPRSRQITVCENYTANTLLDHFITRATELNIPLKLSFPLSHNPGIADADLCVLLGNALENALEATQHEPEGTRFISARALEEADRLYMIFDNSFSGVLKANSENGYLSRKRDYESVGVGLTSIKAVVKKHDGDVRIEAKDGVFRLSILLYKKSEPVEKSGKPETTVSAV